MTTLGETLRQARSAQGMSLRHAANATSISAPYLSDIELDRRIPAEPVMRRIAALLSMDIDVLMARAGRLDEQAQAYIKAHPLATQVLRTLARQQFTDEDLEILIERLSNG